MITILYKLLPKCRLPDNSLKTKLVWSQMISDRMTSSKTWLYTVEHFPDGKMLSIFFPLTTERHASTPKSLNERFQPDLQLCPYFKMKRNITLIEDEPLMQILFSLTSSTKRKCLHNVQHAAVDRNSLNILYFKIDKSSREIFNLQLSLLLILFPDIKWLDSS